MVQNIEQKIVFAISPEGQGDGVPLLLVGVPRAAWVYMKDGKTHHFDLTSVGIPLKLMMYGAADHDAAMKVVQDAMAASGQAYLDERQTDFSIQPKESCSSCAHGLTPGVVATVCGNPDSEFNGKPVHPLGWCDRFTAKDKVA
jgi:hypothetical protein